jgi:hypothetical protein
MSLCMRGGIDFLLGINFHTVTQLQCCLEVYWVSSMTLPSLRCGQRNVLLFALHNVLGCGRDNVLGCALRASRPDSADSAMYWDGDFNQAARTVRTCNVFVRTVQTS